jgi:hypothetical protein
VSAQQVGDYAQSGLTIQSAMKDHARRFPDKRTRPRYILWGGLKIMTADAIQVQQSGIVRAQFLRARSDVEQGIDLSIEGWLRLGGGEQVTLLRTWADPRLESGVEYPFHSNNGQLWTWNVYKVHYPGGQIVEEKWTGNAGFWVEKLSETDRIYHCSSGGIDPPDFESLVYHVTVLGDRLR